MLKEFREFISKGNAVDLAIGVIIGGAFGAIVGSVVNDLLMPLISLATGGIDFTNLYLPLKGQAANLPLADAKAAGAVLAYGAFLQAVVNFLIIAFVLFLIVRALNQMRRPAAPPVPAAPPAPTPTEVLLAEIRDALKAGR
ncbi:MAG: large conductance mechanosensitive channel protein MscL [Anaerolineales bacterium]|nr:large conductance mechanosensitive channel protein MscL [Anaerolineales bacterium]